MCAAAWPATLVSWSRLLAGGFRDPMVGRDVLVGCLSAAATTAIARLLWFVPSWLGHLPPQPQSGPEWEFLGARTIIADIARLLFGAPILWLAALFVLVLLRVLLRKEGAAAVAWVILFTAFIGAGNLLAPEALAGNLIFVVMAAFLLIRFGLLTMVAHDVVWTILETPTDIPGLCLVHRHQPGRNSADRRDNALCLLHLLGRPTRFRKRRARGVSRCGSSLFVAKFRALS